MLFEAESMGLSSGLSCGTYETSVSIHAGAWLTWIAQGQRQEGLRLFVNTSLVVQQHSQLEYMHMCA